MLWQLRLLLILESLDECGSLVGFADLEHWVGMALGLFTFLTKIIVIADTALISDTSNWDEFAPITGNSFMELGNLLLRLLGEVLSNHSLELLGCK